MRVPRAVLPLKYEYIIVGQVLSEHKDEIYEMTEEEFVKVVMYKARGSMNVFRVMEIYHALMEEAGLMPLYEDMKK